MRGRCSDNYCRLATSYPYMEASPTYLDWVRSLHVMGQSSALDKQGNPSSTKRLERLGARHMHAKYVASPEATATPTFGEAALSHRLFSCKRGSVDGACSMWTPPLMSALKWLHMAFWFRFNAKALPVA